MTKAISTIGIVILLSLCLSDDSVYSSTLPETLDVVVNVKGFNRLLHLYKRSVRTDDFHLYTWTQADGFQEIAVDQVPEVRSYRGTVREEPNTRVCAVVMPDGKLDVIAKAGKIVTWSVSNVDISSLLPAGAVIISSASANKALIDEVEPDDNCVPSEDDEKIAEMESQVESKALWQPGYSAPDEIYEMELGYDVTERYYRTYGYSIDNTMAELDHIVNQYDDWMTRDTLISIVLPVVVIRLDDFYFPTSMGNHLNLIYNEWKTNNSVLASSRWDCVASFHADFDHWAGGYAWLNNIGKDEKSTCVNALFHENGHNWNAVHYLYGKDTMGGNKPHHGPLNIQRVLRKRDTEIAQGTLSPVSSYPDALHPYANIDLETTLVNTPVDIDVLSNDWDANGDSISVGYYTQTTVQGGTVHLVGNLLRYTPPADYVGKDIVVYSTSDGSLETTDVVHIEVVNGGMSAYWSFEEGSGSEAFDSSGNGHEGFLRKNTFSEASVDGVIGNALHLPAGYSMVCDSSDIIAESEDFYPLESVSSNFFDPMDQSFTLAFWFKSSDTNDSVLFDKNNKANIGYSISTTSSEITFQVREWGGLTSNKTISFNGIGKDTWYHVAMVIDRGDNRLKAWINGEQLNSTASLSDSGFIFEGRSDLVMGGGKETVFDEVVIYSKALGDAEIKDLLSGATIPAGNPNPCDGESNVALDSSVKWDVGPAGYHYDVYFGTDYQAVFEATVASTQYRGRVIYTSFELAVELLPFTTYYWRVDAINDDVVARGDVWKFYSGAGGLAGGLELFATMDESHTENGIVRDMTLPVKFDGAIIGTPENVGGLVGGSIALDGDDSIDFGNVLDPSVDGYSVSVWFKLNNLSSNAFIIDKGSNSNSSDPGWAIWVRYDGLFECRGNHSGGASGNRFNRYTSSGAVKVGQWYHAVMVLDRENEVIRAWLNGNEVTGTGTGTALQPGGSISSGLSLLLGKRQGGNAVDGLVDEVGIWKRALSVSEVLEVYQAGLDGEHFTEPVTPLFETSFEPSEGFDGYTNGASTNLGVVVDNFGVEWSSPDSANIWNRSDIPPDGVQVLHIDTNQSVIAKIPGADYGVSYVEFSYAAFSSSTNADVRLMYNDNTGAGWIEAWRAHMQGNNPAWESKPWPKVTVPIIATGDVDLKFQSLGPTKGFLVDQVAIYDAMVEITDPGDGPTFKGDPVATSTAFEGVDYSDSLASLVDVADGEEVYFSKIGGPAWLWIAEEGNIGGSAYDADVGDNYFQVRVCDSRDNCSEATLIIPVADKATGARGLDDLSTFAEQWLATDCTDVVECVGDLDGNGNVGFGDFGVFGSNWFSGIQNGLVGHWNMDDAGGEILRDNYNSLNGQLLGGAVWDWADGFNGALKFDGIDDYVEIGDFYGVIGHGARTVSAWVKTISHTASEGTIISWGKVSIGGQWMVQIWDGKLKLNVGAGYLVGTNPVNDGQWHHIAVVLTDSPEPTLDNVIMYVDGAFEEMSYVSSRIIDTQKDQAVQIGAGNSGQFFEGELDDVRIYERTLLQTELNELIRF